MLQQTKAVYFMDETSTHCWATRSKTFYKEEEPIMLNYQNTRGRSRTIIGAVGGHGEDINFHFDVVNATNKEIVVNYLDKLVKETSLWRDRVPRTREDIVICMDNHSAHHSKLVKQWASDNRIALMFLPPYSSTLSPVERVWS